MKNQKYIVRCDRAGVFFGEIAERNGQEVKMRNVRRLWYWNGASDTLQMAAEGVKHPGDCKFTMTVNELVVLDAIEVHPCSAAAAASLEAVPVWKS